MNTLSSLVATFLTAILSIFGAASPSGLPGVASGDQLPVDSPVVSTWLTNASDIGTPLPAAFSFTSPSWNQQSIQAGDILTISWRKGSSGTFDFGFNLLLMRADTDEEVLSISNYHIEGNTFAWSIPADIAPGAYYIRAKLYQDVICPASIGYSCSPIPKGTVDSHAFHITAASGIPPSIVVTSASAYDSGATGVRVAANWRATNTPRGSKVRLSLVPVEGSGSHSIMVGGDPVGKGAFAIGEWSSSTIDFPLTYDGTYEVRADLIPANFCEPISSLPLEQQQKQCVPDTTQTPLASAKSAPFRITGIPAPPKYAFDIVSPSAGRSYAIGDTMNVSFGNVQAPDNALYELVLFDLITRKTVGIIALRASGEGFVWKIPQPDSYACETEYMGNTVPVAQACKGNFNSADVRPGRYQIDAYMYAPQGTTVQDGRTVLRVDAVAIAMSDEFEITSSR